MLNKDYEIVHFAGHGSRGFLFFEAPGGEAQPCPLPALADYLKRYSSIQCVILNACYSLSELCEPITPFTVGMDAPIEDASAIEFARGFYDAIAAGKTIDFAIEEGISACKLKGADPPIKVFKPGK